MQRVSNSHPSIYTQTSIKTLKFAITTTITALLHVAEEKSFQKMSALLSSKRQSNGICAEE